MKINSATLGEASAIASQIETLQAQLDGFNSQAQEVSKQLAPLQSKFQSIIGSMSAGKVSKCAKTGKTGRKFSPEQKAAISAGLRAKWAARKAAVATATVATPTVS